MTSRGSDPRPDPKRVSAKSRLRSFLPRGALALMAAAILLLALNLSEIDYYPGSLPVPPQETDLGDALPTGLSLEAACPCLCSHCHHRARIASSRMWFRVEDRDGWYRLFWAAPEVYYFSSPSFFFAALRNDTSGQVSGFWELQIDYDRECPHRYPAHDCSARTLRSLSLKYRMALRFSPTPAGDLLSDPERRIRIPQRVLGPGSEIAVPRNGTTEQRSLSIEWQLAEPPRFEYAPCHCP